MVLIKRCVAVKTVMAMIIIQDELDNGKTEYIDNDYSELRNDIETNSNYALMEMLECDCLVIPDANENLN